jgi:hypothetical protein
VVLKPEYLNMVYVTLFLALKRKRKKEHIIITCKDILTEINAFRSFANATSTYVEKSLKNIRMSIMETDPVSAKS